MKLPFSDDAMTYSLADHRYVLTTGYVLEKTGIDLSKVLDPGFSSQPQALANHFLDQVSSEIYTWIYEFNQNNLFQEYMLAKSCDLREYLKRAMLEQVLYMLKNGDLSQYSGINVKSGQTIDQNIIVNASIAPNTKRELNKIVPGYNIAVIYQGQIITPLGLKYREDY